MSLSTASLLLVSEAEPSCLYTLRTGKALINYSVQSPWVFLTPQADSAFLLLLLPRKFVL